MVLSDLLSRPTTKERLLDGLKRFNENFEDIRPEVISGYVETRFHERGLSASISSTRLSDGTLRYLCLLAILCHPTPPPLVCIEDPELGLHPSVIPFLAEMMIDAAERTQLMVTTHSEMLVHSLGQQPEAIVVCEKDVHGTHLRRLDPEQLKPWMEKYTLDELWSMGEIGGNP
jgi:predicted ATPase